MSYDTTPILYRSPVNEGGNQTLSRGSSSSHSHSGLILSPLPELADSFNSITDGYASVPFDGIDWGSSSPFFGYLNQNVDNAISTFPAYNPPEHGDATAMNGSNDVMMDTALGPGAGALAKVPVNGYADPPHFAYNDVKADVPSLDSHPSNPFAHVSSHLLQQYITNAGALEQYQAQLGGREGMPMQGQQSETTASTQALFQTPIGTNMNHILRSPHEMRSPSPLLELEVDQDDDISDELVDSASSTDGEMSLRHKRRASEGSGPRTRKSDSSGRRMSSHLPMAEKLQRAQATEGLGKQDKRRVQNKLAQRAFRARSKVANRNVFSRLEHLEELTEQQADRIVKMTELVNRLQTENTGLKANKFESAMQGITSHQQ